MGVYVWGILKLTTKSYFEQNNIEKISCRGISVSYGVASPCYGVACYCYRNASCISINIYCHNPKCSTNHLDIRIV